MEGVAAPGVDARGGGAVASRAVGRIWDTQAQRQYAFRLAVQAGLSHPEADDIAQQVFVKLREQVDPSGGLISIVTKHAIADWHRSRHVREGKVSVPIEDFAGPETTVWPDPAGDVLRARVMKECARLVPEMPPAPRWVIQRVYLQGMELEAVVKLRETESGPNPGESERAHHKRSKDWVYKNHERGLGWLREKIAL